VLRWLRRWRERDDHHLVKAHEPFPDIDQIEELARIVGEAQELDAADERRLYPMRGGRPSSYTGGGSIAGSIRDAARSSRRGHLPL
jgi:hypothetical protein